MDIDIFFGESRFYPFLGLNLQKTISYINKHFAKKILCMHIWDKTITFYKKEKKYEAYQK